MTPIIALALMAGPGFDLKFVPSGITQKMGGYSPIRAEFGSDASGVKKKPAGLEAPSYGKLVFGENIYAFILDEPAGKAAKLYVDSNANGDLTDDPATTWAAQETGMYAGTFKVKMNGQDASVNAYRFDKNDAQRAALKSTLLYYGDFGYEGKGTFGDKTYTVAFAGAVAPNTRMWVDRNGNGKMNGRSESVMANAPFNFEGVTYELKIANGTFEAVKSAKTVDEIKLPPDLSIGQDALKFEATTMDGTKINFPTSYKGKVVLLDFWATWCGPCIAELPNLTKAYEKYHDKGFEILGISFDQENMADKVTAFTKERNMPWQQIYEGKYWETTLGRMHGVEGIPFVLLVDGDTGKILGTSRECRGEQLEKTLAKVFADRG